MSALRESRERTLIAAALLLLLFGAGCDGTPTASATPGDASGPAIRADAAQTTAMRVRVEAVVEGGAADLAEVTGLTSAFRTATVASEVAGRVVARHVEAGRRVSAGDPLVELDDTQSRIAADEARANVGAAKADLAEARRVSERGDALRRKDTISEQQHDNMRFGKDRAASAVALAEATLRRAEQAMADSVVRAPFDGTVEAVAVQIGDYLAPGTPVATLADFERVRLRAGVTAAEADALAPGAIAQVSIPALGGLPRDETVRSVGRLADPGTGTYPVELWLDNPDGRLRAGLVARLRFRASEGASTGPLVPRGALARRDGQLVVFVVEQNGASLRAVLRPVRLGRQVGERVEILTGVSAGERVVTDGLFALRDGARVVVDGDPA